MDEKNNNAVNFSPLAPVSSDDLLKNDIPIDIFDANSNKETLIFQVAAAAGAQGNLQVFNFEIIKFTKPFTTKVMVLPVEMVVQVQLTQVFYILMYFIMNKY
jgi:hypothetical protein